MSYSPSRSRTGAQVCPLVRACSSRSAAWLTTSVETSTLLMGPRRSCAAVFTGDDPDSAADLCGRGTPCCRYTTLGPLTGCAARKLGHDDHCPGTAPCLTNADL